MSQVYNDPRYRGKHIIIANDNIHTAKTGRRASQIIDKIHKDSPEITLHITYIPEADTLVL